MPRKPLTACTWPLCEELSDKPRCPKHQREWAQNQRRGSSTERGYGKPWQRKSEAYLATHPTCEWYEGCDAEATVVDHVIPWREFLSRKAADDLSNLQALCKPHHDYKTAVYDGGFGRERQDPTEMLAARFGDCLP